MPTIQRHQQSDQTRETTVQDRVEMQRKEIRREVRDQPLHVTRRPPQARVATRQDGMKRQSKKQQEDNATPGNKTKVTEITYKYYYE